MLSPPALFFFFFSHARCWIIIACGSAENEKHINCQQVLEITSRTYKLHIISQCDFHSLIVLLVCINESRSSFLLTLPLILLKLDPYHLYQVWNGWELNCLCAHWQELTGLMFHYSTLKVTTLRGNKREWLEN